jgi:hypothetical protein
MIFVPLKIFPFLGGTKFGGYRPTTPAQVAWNNLSFAISASTRMVKGRTAFSDQVSLAGKSLSNVHVVEAQTLCRCSLRPGCHGEQRRYLHNPK